MDAREYFRCLADAAARAREIDRDLDRIRNDEGWRTSPSVAVRGGTGADPTAARAARHIESTRRKLEELSALAPAVREGVAVCNVSLPLRYMHTPIEVVDLEDMEHSAQLIAAYIRSRKEDAPC